MEKYTIREWKEEAACVVCGWPLLVDDIAYDVNGDIYCSRTCANDAPIISDSNSDTEE